MYNQYYGKKPPDPKPHATLYAEIGTLLVVAKHTEKH